MRSTLKSTSVLAALALAAGGAIAADVAAPSEAQAATTANVTATTSEREAAADLAESRVGKTPYSYGGTSLWKGVDCSGLVQAVYSQQGVSLPRTSGQQKSAVRSMHQTWLRKGDLVFYGDYHVGIYVGDGYIVDAPSSGRMVEKRRMWASGDRSFGTLRPA